VQVAWTAAAIADLAALRRHLGRRNRAAAKRIAQAILAAVRLLQRSPAIGRPGRVPGTRELVVTGTPYLVPYRARDNVIEVLRVLHGARRWPDQF
jgi:toxin ParE1/3/4